jgi:hypothetical protein
MERLKKLPEKTRGVEINKRSNTSNHKTAIRTFINCLTEGLIKRPKASSKSGDESEEAFTRFTEEEDPDAAFKRFVTPYNSTRPDLNCRKVEGTLEG